MLHSGNPSSSRAARAIGHRHDTISLSPATLLTVLLSRYLCERQLHGLLTRLYMCFQAEGNCINAVSLSSHAMIRMLCSST